MYFPDLHQNPDKSLIFIGWLSKDYEFPQGEVNDNFISKLKLLCDNPVMLHRGFHVCEFCTSEVDDWSKWAKIGNGHVKVQCDSNSAYWAPTMIHHYVSVHNYMPPQEFIDAVMKI